MKKAIAISILTALSGVAVVSAQAPADRPAHGECHGGKGGPRGAHHFQKLDANGDKVVTKDEMLKQVTEHFDRADANKDGQVTADERKAAFEAHAKERFAADDKNKDGALSKDELPAHFAEKLSKLDTNNDGKLTQAELAALKAMHEKRFEKHADAEGGRDKTRTRAELVTHVTERFTKLDSNNDGKLTEDEMKQGHHGRGHRHHDEG